MTDFKKDINNEIFQNAVNSLQLRFPVAEIQRATNESKGNISSFLHNKKSVSDSFLKTFADAFKIDLRDFGYTNGLVKVENKKPTLENKEWATLKEFNEHLIRENEFLKAMLLKK